MSKTANRKNVLARRPKNPLRAREKVKALRTALADHLVESDLEGAIGVLRDAMSSMKRENISKFSSIEVPDTANRLAAAKLVLEYAVGKPTQISEVSVSDDRQFGETDPLEVAERLQTSGLALGDIIDAYVATTKHAEPVDEDEQDQRAEDKRLEDAFVRG